MSIIVSIRHLESGEVLERHSVDAADLLATGEYEQVAGPTVRIAPHAAPKPEPGPAYAAPKEAAPPSAPPQLDRPHLKHRGFGKWDVHNAEGAVVNGSPLKRADADALLATLK